jgi:hypothetical protein
MDPFRGLKRRLNIRGPMTVMLVRKAFGAAPLIAQPTKAKPGVWKSI